MHYHKLFRRSTTFQTAQADQPLTAAVDHNKTWKMDHFPRFSRRKKHSTSSSPAATSESLNISNAPTNTDSVSDQASLNRPGRDDALASTTSIIHSIAPSSTAPSSIAPSSTVPSMTTLGKPLPGESGSPAVRPPPPIKRNTFDRVFRRTPKRARDASPAALPTSPATVLSVAYDAPVGPSPNMPQAVPQVTGPESPTIANQQPGAESARRMPLRIPAFLELSQQDIAKKFDSLNWLERRRMASADRDPRWLPVQDPCARFLDRYNNIWPWNSNRIKLRVPEGCLDYINASPIALEAQARPAAAITAGSTPNPASPRDRDRFIAMQGPKGITTGHMWRMIVEQVESPGVIVMLTETHEGPIEKCYPYFPRSPNQAPLEIGKHAEFDDGFRASVRCEEIQPTPAGDAIELRKLVVRVYKQRGERTDEGGGKGQPSQDSGCATAGVSDAAEPDEDVDVKMKSPQSAECSVEVPSTTDQDVDVQMLSPVKEKTSVDGPVPAANVGGPCAEDDRPQTGLAVAEGPDKEMQSQPPQQECEGDEGEDGEDGYEDRVIWHLAYKKWPDFGVPRLADLDSFFTLMRLSREKNARPENPRVVHCSAGVGRSGTFIALDYLMRELEAGMLENWDEEYQQKQQQQQSGHARSSPTLPTQSSPSLLNLYQPASASSRRISMPAHIGTMLRPAGFGGGMTTPPPDPNLMRGDDLVFSTVNLLREQRRQMVQAEMQFVFIYQVMRKLWQDRYCDERGTGEPAAKRLVVDPFMEW